MTIINNYWSLLTKPFSSEMSEILFQQYFGAQLIAMAGRHLIQQREDDSNTSMVFNSMRQSLIGETLPGNIRASLDLTNLSIALLRKNLEITPSLSLPGLTMEEAVVSLSQTLNNVGINSANLKNQLHYDLPDHELLHGSEFHYDRSDLIQENIAHRHNAEILLKKVASSFEDAEQVRIWPHHFDTGSLIPLAHNVTGELTQSAGLGWAIPDGMVDESYYYLSIWSKESLEFPTRMPSLKDGKWMMPNWHGAVLRLSEILNYHSKENQQECIFSFFKSGLKTIKELSKS